MGRGHGTPGITAGFDERACPVVNRVRQPMQAGRRNEHFIGQRARPPRDPDLMVIRADMSVSRTATTAVSAAQHGVCGDAGAVPGFIDPGADRCDDTAPLVAGTQGEARFSLREVGQFSGEQFDVGTADPDAMDIHDYLPRARNRDVDFVHPG